MPLKYQSLLLRMTLVGHRLQAGSTDEQTGRIAFTTNPSLRCCAIDAAAVGQSNLGANLDLQPSMETADRTYR